MLVNIVVPGYPKALPFHINPAIPLQSYSWTDIVSANIIADTSKHVRVTSIQYENTPLEHNRSLMDAGIQENAILYVHVAVQSMQDFLYAQPVVETVGDEPEEQEEQPPVLLSQSDEGPAPISEDMMV